MPYDHATGADAVARPGIDTRTFVTMGLVEPETGDQHSVLFTDAQGNPNPYGAQVMVKLQPNGNVLPCRVASQCAGDQEGEWHPFVGGDDAVVLIPDGDEKNGGVIVGRLNQHFDTFPTTVAGQPVTGNQVAFKRLLPPWVLESGTAVILRVATTGAALTLDQTGNTYLSDGNGNALYMRSDAVSLQLAETAAAFQLDPSGGKATIVAASGDTVFAMDGSQDADQTKGTLSISTLGNGGTNHVVTVEALGAILTALCAVIAPTPVSPAQLATAFLTASTTPVAPPVSTAIQAALAKPKTPLGSAGVGSQGVLVD